MRVKIARIRKIRSGFDIPIMRVPTLTLIEYYLITLRQGWLSFITNEVKLRRSTLRWPPQQQYQPSSGLVLNTRWTRILWCEDNNVDWMRMGLGGGSRPKRKKLPCFHFGQLRFRLNTSTKQLQRCQNIDPPQLLPWVECSNNPHHGFLKT